MPGRFTLVGASSIGLAFYQNGQSFDTANATWNNASGGATWNGGDQTGSAVYSQSVTQLNAWYTADLTSLVQGWVDGNTANDGLLVRAQTEATSTGFVRYDDSHSTSDQPYLTVYYGDRTGADGIQTYLNTNLTDKTTLGIDPATGNALMSSTDMSIAGTGPDSTFAFKHYYNSYEAYLYTSSGTNFEDTNVMAPGWYADNSMDESIYPYLDGGGAVDAVMPGGINDVFTQSSAAGSNFTPPDGVKADLTLNNPDDGFNETLVDHKSGLTYNWAGSQLSTVKTPTSQTISFSTNAMASVNDTKGRSYSENYSGPRLTGFTDNNGNRSVSFAYNSSNQLTSYTDANGAVVNYTYNPTTGELASISDPSTGHLTQLSYITSGGYAGFVRQVTQSTTDCADGSNTVSYTTTYAYSSNTNGGPSNADGSTTVTDPNSLVSTYYWDAKRRVVQVTDPAGNPQSDGYDASSGEISSFTDDLGSQSAIGYANGYASSFTEPKSGANAAASSTVNQRSSTTPGSGFQGPQAIPTQITDAQGNQTNYTVPANGANGGVDEITKISQTVSGGSSATQSLAYNGNGTVSSMTNANNQTTSFGYDSNANLATVTPPAPLQPTTYTYDGDNRVQSVTDGNGNTTTYTYDADDRPTRVSFSDGTYLTYTYDTDGNLLSRRNRNGTTDTFTFDGLNRPTGETYQGESETFCYDESSHLTSITTGGGTVSYAYNNVGVLDAVTEPGGSGCSGYNTTNEVPPANSRCIAVSMDADNRPTTIAFPGGVIRRTSYLNSGKVAENYTFQGLGSNHTVLENLVYNWVKNGTEQDLLQSTSDERTGTTVTANYAYDGLNRLLSAAGLETGTGTNPSTQNRSWSYDLEGNITKTVAGSATIYLAYNNADQLCWQGNTNGSGCTSTPSGDTSYSYDNDGNLTGASNGFAASYDAAEDTAGFTGTIDTGGTSTTGAGYTDFGQTQLASLGTTNFTSTIEGLGAATSTSTGQRIDYTYLPTGQILSMRVEPSSGGPTQSSNYYYSMVDQQGSILGMSDAYGNTAAQYAYDPYGATLASSGPQAGTNRIRWLATYDDTETGLYHFGARYYSPGIMRFLQTDPKRQTYDLAQQDVYSYAGGSPIDRADPAGTCDEYCGKAVGALAGVAGVIFGGAAGFVFGGTVGAGAGAAFLGTFAYEVASQGATSGENVDIGGDAFDAGVAGVFGAIAGSLF